MTYKLIRKEYYLSTWIEKKVDSVTFPDRESAEKALEEQEAGYDKRMRYVNEDKESLAPINERETIIKVKKPETKTTYESVSYNYADTNTPLIRLTIEEEE